MTEQTTEVFSRHFRNTRAGEPKTNQAYLAVWIAYQRGALSADEFMRSLEHEFLRSMEQLEARWTAVKW
jgi:hypothetical protein